MTNPAPQQPPVRPAAKSEPAHLTVCGVVAVVFGALALVLSFIPIINNLAAILGAVGAVLALIALVGTFRGKKRGKALSVVAAALSVLAIVVTLMMQSAASKAIDDSVKESKGISTSQVGSAPAAKEQDAEGDVEGLHVKIVSAAKAGNDYEGKPTVMVSYEWTNKTSKNNSFMALAHAQVFQNGSALDTAVYTDAPAGYDAGSSMTEVQPNATAAVTVGYVLKDDSPVTVDVSAFLSVGDDSKVTHVFTLQ
ncbi:DUF5067 domain-containing protein [Bifidobacterium avesanii]|uniref:DUF5067 domain-containing protein n=1 Tax=Bifidobacterium avesanii TaxID=1798157 RepID=A0A7K3TIW0_9BIFI|nr:DUF5067 domain-containing protein [Bifidobacterium avesanii]KAB8289913.1 hypothetical protein DSM100685_1554 [Bifidobacterium avesanii]NEG78846.1 DUF5067 domain-containing protein [Bifidobacterium avesanii]